MPPSTFCMISSTLTAWLIARRTRTSVSGVLPARPSPSSWRYTTRRIFVAVTRAVPERSMAGIWSGGTARMMSTPPESSSAIWVAVSGITRKVSVLIAGAPFQYCSFASSTVRSPLRHSTNLNGPVPTGFFAKAASPFSLMYRGGTIPKLPNVRISWISG